MLSKSENVKVPVGNSWHITVTTSLVLVMENALQNHVQCVHNPFKDSLISNTYV